MSFTQARTDLTLMICDSLGNNGGGVAGVPWQPGYWLALEPRFGGFTVQPLGVAQTAKAAPKYMVDPQTGRKSLTLTTIGMTTYLNQFPAFNKCILELGINDCADRAIAALTLANMIAQYTTIISAIAARIGGLNIMHCGPYAHDTGDLSAFITEFDTNIAPIVQGVGGVYCPFSGLPSTVGVYTTADGTHTIFGGSVLLGNQASSLTTVLL